ncbi:MAG: hypothetical protein HETSPECPRED_009909 [Heterodermia speciosa]|uniref:Amino acid permease/ SLC12A domain-containing protein n=1 Tax=Heterodermia speciosa TaxID=116794 RepID=A0A8H3G6S0_9LECA|nr:MAG: hypothetical protein HETSPECPRED_009909 [Heterodermia speciosa]
MSLRDQTLESAAASDDGCEGQALLSEARLSGLVDDDVDVSFLSEAMTTAKTVMSNKSGDGSELALDNLRDPNDPDDANLRAHGHEAALQRNFSPLAALGLGFSITNSWVGYLSNFGQNLIYGGPQSVVFGLLVATVVQWIITLGLSEVASAFPSAGGQYHFTYILAPPKHKKFAAFVIGAKIGASHALTLSLRIHRRVLYAVEPQEADTRRDFPHTIRARYKWLEYWDCLGNGCWKRIVGEELKHLGLEGSSTSRYAYGGTDGAIHIAEEMPRPSKNIPKAMNLTMAIGFLTAFPMSLALMFGMTSIDAVLNSSLPSAEIFYQITQSRAIVTFMMCWVILVYYMGLASQWVTAGRMTWAFARDRGIPFSQFFSYVSIHRDFPVRATILSVCFCCLYGLLYLTSTTAFNSIVTGAVLYLNITYAVPQGILFTRGRAKSLPPRALNLGALGYACNGLAPVLVTFIGIFICFPPQLPVTVSNMNYTPVILVGLFTVILGLWYTRGEKFVGPKIDWELLNLTGCK